MLLRFLDNLTRPSHHVVPLACILLFVLAMILALRSGDQLRYRDEIDYHRLAKHMIAGEGYVDEHGQLNASRPPGYPMFLSVLYRMWDRPLAAKLANAALLAATGWLLAQIVGRVSPRGMCFAPLMLLLFPIFSYTATTLYPQILGTFLLVTAIYCLVRWPDSWLSVLVCGAIFGFLILVIPAFMLILPIIAMFLLIVRWSNPLRACISAGLVILCAALVICPWTIRNMLVFKTFVPVSTNSGVNLLLGNCENSGPNDGVNVDISRYKKEITGMSETQVDRHLRRRALDWIANHPAEATKLYALKVLNYFNFQNKLASQAEASRFKDIIMFLSYYPLLGLAIVRCFLWRRYPFTPTELLCYVLYFGNAFLSAFFFTRIRFRIPFDALLIACDAILIGYFLSTWISRHPDPEGQCDR